MSRATTLSSDLWIQAAIVAALVLRLVRLNAAPLWLDEVDTAQWIAMPWGEMVRTVVSDNHTPGYFVLLKAWSALAGTSPWALRLPSVLLSCAMVPLIAATAGTLMGRTAQRWAAWLTAISPYLIEHAQEARMYPLLGVIAAAHLLILARFFSGRTSSLGATYALTAVALVFSHYYALFFVVGGVVAVVLATPRPRNAWLPAMAATCTGLSGVLLMAALFARRTGGGSYLMGWFGVPGVIWSMLSGYAFLPSSEELHYQATRAVVPHLPVALAAALPLLVSAVAAVRSLGRSARVLLLVTLAGTLLGPFVARALCSAPIHPRYFSAGAPALILLLAAGAPARLRFDLRSVAITVLVGIMVTSSAFHLMYPNERREDVVTAGRWLDANVPASDEILVTSVEMARLARFHWPGRRFRVYPDWQTVAGPENASAIAAQLPFASSERAIYVVGRAWRSDPTGSLQRALAERYGSCPGTEARGIRILCLLRPPAGGETNGRVSKAP